MKPEKDNIKDIFSSKLKGFEPELPASLWERIDADLSPQEPVIQNIQAKTASIYKYVAWIASAAAVILAVLLLLPEKTDHGGLADSGKDAKNIQQKEQDIPIIKEDKADKQVAEAINKVEIKPTPVPLSRSNKSFASSTHQSQPVTRPIIDPIQIEKDLEEAFREDKNVIIPMDNAPVMAEKVDSASKEETSQKIADASTPEKKLDKPKDEDALEKELAEKIAAFEEEGRKTENLLVYNADNIKNKDTESLSNGFELGVAGSGGFSKSKEIQNQTRLASADYAHVSNGMESNDLKVNSVKEQQMKLNHNHPISFGVSVSKKINDRVSLESGVVYTYLYSKVKSLNNSDYELKDSQYFHYLGIPLNVNYKFAEWNKLRFYVSAGGMIQKDFYGRMRTSENVDGLLNSATVYTKNISQKNPQFSLNGSVGLSYPVYKKMSVYANTGASYYFDTNNKYETIYSDKRWLFNLNLGIKFEF